MFNNVWVRDALAVCQILVLPAIVMMRRSVKRQVELTKDIGDLKRYVRAICEKLGIFCSIKDE